MDSLSRELNERIALDKFKEGLRLVTPKCPCSNPDCEATETLVEYAANSLLEHHLDTVRVADLYARMLSIIKDNLDG